MKPATIDARQRRLPGDRLAPKARTSANVRVTSEAAKANHRHGALGAARPFLCGNRAIPAPAAKLAPMVNGVRTDMVNERLIWRRGAASFSRAAQRRTYNPDW